MHDQSREFDYSVPEMYVLLECGSEATVSFAEECKNNCFKCTPYAVMDENVRRSELLELTVRVERSQSILSYY